MYMCLFVSLCVTSGRVFGVCACVHVRVHASVMVFWRLVLACTFNGPTFTDLLVSTGVLCVCSDEEQRRKEQKKKKKKK